MLEFVNNFNTVFNFILGIVVFVAAHPIVSAGIVIAVWFTFSGFLLAVKDVSYQLWGLFFRFVGWLFKSFVLLMTKGIGQIFAFAFSRLRKKG